MPSSRKVIVKAQPYGGGLLVRRYEKEILQGRDPRNESNLEAVKVTNMASRIRLSSVRDESGKDPGTAEDFNGQR